MPIAADMIDFYVHLVSFQTNALAYVANGADEGVRLARAQEVMNSLALSRANFGKFTFGDAGGICGGGMVDCGGVCVPPDMCQNPGGGGSAST